MAHNNMPAKKVNKVPLSLTDLKPTVDGSFVSDVRVCSACENRCFCDSAYPPSHRAAPLIVELEAVFPTANCNDRSPDRLLVAEHTDILIAPTTLVP